MAQFVTLFHLPFLLATQFPMSSTPFLISLSPFYVVLCIQCILDPNVRPAVSHPTHPISHSFLPPAQFTSLPHDTHFFNHFLLPVDSYVSSFLLFFILLILFFLLFPFLYLSTSYSLYLTLSFSFLPSFLPNPFSHPTHLILPYFSHFLPYPQDVPSSYSL